MKSAETSSRNLNQTSPERLDHSIWLVAFALMGLGLVLVYSASFIFAEEKFGDALYFFKRQTAFVVVSLGLLGVASHFPYRLLQKFFWVFYAAMIAGLLATFIPGLAHRAGGASRWIALPMGFRLEPAEYVKLFAPVVFGWLLTRETKKTDPWWKSPAINLGLVLLPAFLMLKQPDFGSTVLFFAVGFAMLFCFGLPWKYIFSAAVVSVPLFYVLVMRVAYRRDRVLAFLNPWADPTHSGFQVIQSLLSLHAGGLFGAGLGKGQAKLFFLPEAHTDFILAVLGEETGFIGLVLVFLLFGWLIFRALQISYRCKEPFGQKLSLGLGALLAFQVVVNAGVVMGLLPTKGLTMPFLSYGGSSLVATSLACGILVNIHRNGKKVMSRGGLVIAGGGTGGHIYPAIAIAQVLKNERPELAIDFVGTRRGLETKIVPREGFPLHFIEVGALNNVGLVQKIKTLFQIPWAVVQSFKILLRLKPNFVLGVGGYASGPFMIAAILMGKKTALFESNAHPGLTNRWLSRFVSYSFINFEVSKKAMKNGVVVGMPIRTGLVPMKRTKHDRLRVLVFGGSQGARGINTVVQEAIGRGGDWLSKVEIVHQIGSRDFAAVDEKYKAMRLPASAKVQWLEFLYDMPVRYAWSDIVVCRSGASTVAELAACKKTAVLIPFAQAADNHQQSNAEALLAENAAMMILQKDFTPEAFVEVVTNKLLPSAEFEENISKFYKPQSAEKIAKVILENV